MTAPTQSNPAYLEVNIPRIGRVESLMYFGEKPSTKNPGKTMPATFGFKGAWDMGGGQTWEGMVYVDEHKLDTNVVAAGFAAKLPDYQGQPRFEWLLKGQPLQLLLRLQGNKRIAYVMRLDPNGQPYAASQPAAGAVSPPPAASPRVGQPNGQDAVRVSTQATPASGPPSPENPWTALARSYERARVIACQVWGENYDPVALVAATATLFIEGNKRGLSVTPKPDNSQYAHPPAALNEPPLDQPPPWAFGFPGRNCQPSTSG